MEERIMRLEKCFWWLVLILTTIASIALLSAIRASGGFWEIVASETGNLSEMAIAIIAGLALREAIRQLRAWNRRTAVDTYRKYLTLAIDNPKESRRDKHKDQISVDDPKYDAFVTYLLFAAEESPRPVQK